MKQREFLFLIISLFFISCTNRKYSQKVYEKAESFIQIDEMFEYTEESETFLKIDSLLNKSIKFNKSWWQPYRQKIELYKVLNEPSKKKSEKIKSVYELWLLNGNNLSLSKKFSYSAALYVSGEKEKAEKKFIELYYEKTNIEKQCSFEDFIVIIESGILIDSITEYNLDSYLSTFTISEFNFSDDFYTEDYFRQFFLEYIEEKKSDKDNLIFRCI